MLAGGTVGRQLSSIILDFIISLNVLLVQACMFILKERAVYEPLSGIKFHMFDNQTPHTHTMAADKGRSALAQAEKCTCPRRGVRCAASLHPSHLI